MTVRQKGPAIPVYFPDDLDLNLDVNMRDGLGNPLTSTLVGANQALDVNIVGGAGAGGTSMLDDSPFAVTVSAVTPAGAIYRSVRDLVDDNDVGALAMTQRRALLASLETLAGDSAMDEVNDALRVNIVAGGGAGGTSMIDDAPFTTGATGITPMGAMFDDAAPDSVDEGDAGIPRMSANRNLYVTLRDAAGNERGLNIDAAGSLSITDGGLSITTDFGGVAQPFTDGGGTITVDDGGVPLDVNIASALPAGANQIGSVIVDDIEDGAGDSIMDAANDAMRVNVVVFPDNEPFNMAQVSGTALSVNVGNADAGTQRVVLASDQPTVDVTVGAALPAGGNNIGDVDVLTVPAPLNVVGGGTEAAALRVTIADDSTGELTVNGTVTATVAAKEILQQPGTAVTWGSAGGEDETITLANLANNAGRLGEEHDFGATHATRWKWYLTSDMDAAPTIRTTLDIYMSWSWDGTSYEGEHTGADGALGDTDQLDRMHLIGSLVLDDDTDTQRAGGIFFVQDRYGAPVIFNNATGQSLTNNAALHEFRIVPMPQEIQ